MATYNELYDVYSNTVPGAQAILNKIVIAVMIAAETIRVEDPATSNHANRLIWAKQALSSPYGKSYQMFPALIAQNSNATQSQILNVSDVSLQTAVNNAINIFADGT
jgi:hypothetical protein